MSLQDNQNPSSISPSTRRWPSMQKAGNIPENKSGKRSLHLHTTRPAARFASIACACRRRLPQRAPGSARPALPCPCRASGRSNQHVQVSGTASGGRTLACRLVHVGHATVCSHASPDASTASLKTNIYSVFTFNLFAKK
jgi:hypothetical protein